MDGKVLDAESKRPVAGAKVWAKSCPEQVVVTGADGGFLLNGCRETRWHLALPIHIVPSEIPIVFEASGYGLTERWPGDRGHVPNYVVELHRK